MKLTTYRAFGLVFIINEHIVGDIYTVKVPNDARCITYCVKGKAEVINTDTNQSLSPYEKGLFIDSRNEPVGNYQYTCVEDSVIFCYDPKLNNNKFPTFTRFDIAQNATKTIPINTKYFLMSGSLTINNVEFSGPSRIHITSGEVECHANTECAGLIIS